MREIKKAKQEQEATVGEELEAGGDQRRAPDLPASAEEEPDSESRALAIATEGGPLAVEIELEPLDIHPLIPPASAELAIEPHVGFWGRYWLFILMVVAPVTIAAVYLFAMATPRYASSASFIVRSIPQTSPATMLNTITQLQNSAMLQLGSSTAQMGMLTAPQAASPTSLSTASQLGSVSQPLAAALTPGSSLQPDEIYAVNAYLTSRDVADQLIKTNNLREILSRPEGDFLFRYPTFWLPNDDEFLYRRFQWMVSTKVNDVTLISTVEVNAFRPQDALLLANAMLQYAEALVNKLNKRYFDDGLAEADRFVAEAHKEVDEVESELQAYRNASGSIDPNTVAQSKLKVIESLSTQLAQIQAAIAEQTAIAAASPTLATLKAQAQSYRDQIEKRKLEIAGPSGNEADKLEKYDELTVRAQLAAIKLAAAVANRNQASEDVARQHLFIQIISRPRLSQDYARYPRVALDLALLLALCLTMFYLLRKFGGTQNH